MPNSIPLNQDASRDRPEQGEPSLSVECHSGYAYADQPRAFTWRGKRRTVDSIEAQWRCPDGKYFRVRVSDGHLFDLKYRERDDEWEIASL